MGRKKNENAGKNTKKMLIDKIGEKVEFDKCPDCSYHTDCFCWIEGKCTALKECGGKDCVFYRPNDVVVQENKEIYKRLKKQGRTDLILKNINVLSALGVLDDEIVEADAMGDEFSTFEEADFQEQLRQAQEELDSITGECETTDAGTDIVADTADEV